MKQLTLILCALLSTLGVEGAHIVGGDMTYQCLGNGEYRITLKVYKDCFSSGPNVADFDDPAFITIYDANGDEINTFNVTYNQRTIIPPVTNNPCVTPPANVCVEEAIYSFDVTLGTAAGGYDVVYTRCCRNATITNIVTPSDVGATYTVNIDPAATTTCNSSPTFRAFPPIVICAGEPLVFDHSATDLDGDVLVYEFCTPFVGGDPNDPQPLPPLPPPFGQVAFLAPYNVNFPVASAPALNINPSTGLLTGTPTISGQYVVGICVKEFRNGVLIGETRRDFQFNVTPCNYNVEADIPIIDPANGGFQDVKGVYSYECTDLSVTFTNTSLAATSYLWNFGDLTTNADTSRLFQPTYTYPDSGQYIVTLIANPGFSCADTVKVIVRVFPGFDVDFNFQSRCEGEPYSFQDLSSTQYGTINSWTWRFGDGNSSTSQSPQHVFNQGGTYPTRLIATNTKGCRDTVIRNVEVYYKPDVDFDNTAPCIYTDIIFTDVSVIQSAQTGARAWYLNDSLISGNPFVVLLDSQVSNNAMKLVVETSRGCKDSITKNFTVNPLPVVTASGDTSICRLETVLLSGTGGITYEWRPNNGLNHPDSANTLASPADTTLYVVYVTDTNGCINTDSVLVNIWPLPTADAGNDTIICEGEGHTLQGSTNGISYLWQPGALLSDSTIASPFWVPDSTTVFTLTTESILGCINKDSVAVEVQYPIDARLANVPELCIFDTLQLQATGGKYYLWAPAELLDDNTIANPKVSPQETTLFTLIASNDCPQFTDTLEVEVVVHPLPEVDAGPDDTINRDEFTTIAATSNASTYLWFPPDGLEANDVLNPVASPFNTTQYILSVTSDKGCLNSDSVNIYVEIVNLLLLPNAFSPNNDGYNDWFRIIKTLNIQEILDFRIFNRWGQVVFETSDLEGFWNGEFKGRPQDMGVFVYSIRAITKDGDEIVHAGNVTLVR